MLIVSFSGMTVSPILSGPRAQQGARPALWRWKQSFQMQVRNPQIKEYTALVLNKYAWKTFHGGSQSAPQISRSGIKWVFVVAGPRLGALNEALREVQPSEIRRVAQMQTVV